MTRKYYFFSLVLLVCWAGCSKKAPHEHEHGTHFKLEAVFDADECPLEGLYIYEEDGLELKELFLVPAIRRGEKLMFQLAGHVPRRGFFYIGTSEENMQYLILGGEDESIQIQGDCKDFRATLEVHNSRENAELTQLQNRLDRIEGRINQMMQSIGNTEAQPATQSLLNKKQSLLDSLEQANPFLAKYLRLSSHVPFTPNRSPASYPNALEYYASEYLNYPDLESLDYAYIPLFADNIFNYTERLLSSGKDAAWAEAHIDSFLVKLPQPSKNHKVALASIIDASYQLQAYSFLKYAEVYMENYVETEPLREKLAAQIQGVQQMKKGEKALNENGIAPNIELPNPNGEIKELQELRGKYVLIDFWASWCKPCREDNPELVKLYNQYKSKGFEVYGVSLDDDEQKWKAAIRKDGLLWTQVSDLQGWTSKAVRLYRLQTIPATFLLNPEGEIIARDLRGAELGPQLSDIFDTKSQ